MSKNIAKRLRIAAINNVHDDEAERLANAAPIMKLALELIGETFAGPDAEKIKRLCLDAPKFHDMNVSDHEEEYYIATDRNGDVWAYTEKPDYSPGLSTWFIRKVSETTGSRLRLFEAPEGTTVDNWKETLMKKYLT